MKILKLKSTLFSLMAIAMLTVFLTSCEEDKLPLPTDDIQKSETSSTLENYMKEGQETSFYLPLELKDADEETIKQYLFDMSAEQIEGMEDSYRIENYHGNSEIELRGCTHLYSICYYNPYNGKYRKATLKICLYDVYKIKVETSYSYHDNSSCK